VKKSLEDVEEEVEGISKAISKLGASKLDIKKELKPLTDKLEDVEDDVKKAKKSREAISGKVKDVSDTVEDLEKVEDDIKKVASMKSVEDLEENLKDVVSEAKALNRKGVNAVGKIAVKNQRYMKAIYSSLHR